MATVFKELNDYLDKLCLRYANALGAFCIFETLEKARSPRHAGKYKVNKNISAINSYYGFFAPTKETIRVYFFLELAKFFDRDKRTNSIWNLLDKIDEQAKHLSKEEFFKYREEQGSPVIDILRKDYHSINKKDLARIRHSLKSIEDITKKIKKYRDQNIAHDDITKSECPVTRMEIKKVFVVIKSILSKLSLRLSFSSWYYKNVQSESERHTRMVIDALIYKNNKKSSQSHQGRSKW